MRDELLALIVFFAAYPVMISLITPIINKKKMKKQEALRDEYLNSIKVKDKVVTISGIYGTIKGIHGNIVKLEVANNVEIEIDKASIMGTLK